MSKLNVAIVGAGMSGLLFAIALRKLAPDVEFEVYEGASHLSEVGAGISTQERSWCIMQALDLDESLLAISGTGEQRTMNIFYRKSDQKEGVPLASMMHGCMCPDVQAQDRSDFGLLYHTAADVRYVFHRADLQKAFLNTLERTKSVHLLKRLVSYTQPDDTVDAPIQLHFSDGSTAECDILVGADGVKSVVRNGMYTQMADIASAAGDNEKAEQLRSHIPAVFSGNVMYRTLIHKDALPEESRKHPVFNQQHMSLYAGKHKQIVAYQISQGRSLNVALVVNYLEQEGIIYEGPWTSTVDADEVKDQFKGWEPNCEEIVKHVDGALKWVVNVVTKLPTYVHGRVALMGDAAHAMTTHQAAGAGQGIEDAFLLAQLLGRADVTKKNISAALQAYDEVRRPLSQDVAERSRMTGKTYHFSTPDMAYLTAEQSSTGNALSREQLQQIGDDLKRLLEWQNATTVAQDTERAYRILDGILQ